MSSPFAMQPPVLLNRLFINLKSLSTPSSSQGSSARHHWSRFFMPNFHVPDSGSFLGNIGEDLQDGHEPPTAVHYEMGVIRLNTEGSLEAGLKETFTTSSESSISYPMVTQVSLQTHSGSKRDERTLSHLGWSPGQPPRLWKTS